MTATVIVRPAGIELELADGEPLLRAAERHGYRWPTICGGLGTCRTCFVEVDEGRESCSDIGGLEREGIEALRRPVDGRTRLACQLTVSGGTVTVVKRGVRRRTEE